METFLSLFSFLDIHACILHLSLLTIFQLIPNISIALLGAFYKSYFNGLTKVLKAELSLFTETDELIIILWSLEW